MDNHINGSQKTLEYKPINFQKFNLLVKYP